MTHIHAPLRLAAIAMLLFAHAATAVVIDFEDPASQACFASTGGWCEIAEITIGDYRFTRFSGRMNVVSDAAAQNNTTFQINGTTTFSLVGDAWMPWPRISISRVDGTAFRLEEFLWAAGNIPGNMFQVQVLGVAAAPEDDAEQVFDLVVPTPPCPGPALPTDWWSRLILPPALGHAEFSSYQIAPLGRLIRLHMDDLVFAVPEPEGQGALALACVGFLAIRRARRRPSVPGGDASVAR